ncbi:MAG: molybdopterin molybdenumtransferase MoeA [Sphingobacteriales bacterium]|nr:MAG: molybdopterin molybdenumtransferase MoeA [Sphingobacteriales bacterium]
MAPVILPLHKAGALTLASDIHAAIDIPAFPQSSMDGYAFSFEGWGLNKELTIDGEIAAGDNVSVKVIPQKAVRIFTGAAVPDGADTVVMQEKVRTQDGKLFIEDEKLQVGANIRPRGSEIKAGMLALPKESRLSPAAVGFLAGIGITEVPVIPHPSVTIVVTGNELQAPGQPLGYGQVYESNSFALLAALKNVHIEEVEVVQVRDEPAALTTTLQQALHNSDLVLLTGGVSVGDYDHVPQAALNCGVTQLFHKVAQKPGKPFYFGMWKQKPVFGLPGNPSSVLTCFYLYVVQALEMLSQRSFGLRTLQVPLGQSYQKPAGLTHFLKGEYDGEKATPLPAQESYRMHSFARANCLIEIDESVTFCKEGSVVTVHLLCS